jgi:hypothetical protein
MMYIYTYIYMCSELLCMYGVIIVILCDSYIYIYIYVTFFELCTLISVQLHIYRYIFKY